MIKYAQKICNFLNVPYHPLKTKLKKSPRTYEITADIIYPEDGWILKRAGEELKGVRGNLTYYINYAIYEDTPGITGAFFTHLEPQWQKKFDEVASKVDFAVCLNKHIKQYLIDKGVKRVEIIQHGYDPRLKKEIVFGFCGREYKSGRKATELLPKKTIKFGYNDAPEIYKKIDYLLIPSRIEGGPVPLIDAISAGVPVIAREGVGWVDDFPCIHFKTDEDFKKIIHQLTNPPSWNQWRRKHQLLFDSLK
jgi:hypothetical protein